MAGYPDFTKSALIFCDIYITSRAGQTPTQADLKDKVIAYLPDWDGTLTKYADKPLPYRELYSTGAAKAFRQNYQESMPQTIAAP
jgi:hypothetical protein